MNGFTRRSALAVFLSSAALPRVLQAQQAFSPAAFVAVVDLVCDTVATMAAEVAGTAPAPGSQQALGSLQIMFVNLPTLFGWMQEIEDGSIPAPSDAEFEKVTMAIRRARDCGERFQEIIEEWSKRFGPDPSGGGSGQGTVDPAAWARQKIEVDWRWSAIIVLAVAILLKLGRGG